MSNPLDRLVPKRDTPARVFPVPEVLRPGQWDVVASGAEGEGYVDLSGRQMIVPLQDTPGAARVRAHEMAHAKWSPSDGLVTLPTDADPRFVQACEDMRMHRLLTGVGIDLSADLWSGVQWGPDTPDWHKVTCGVAFWGTGDQTGTVSKLSPPLVDIVRQVKARLWDVDAPTWDDTVQAARLLTRLFGERQRADARAEAEEGELADDPDMRKREVQGHESGTPWGQMTVETVPLSNRLPVSVRSRTAKRFLDCGHLPRAMHRLPVDQRVFTRRRKAPGGTVAIDMSGSMRVRPDDVVSIMSAIPAGTIATYSGDSESPTGEGVLRIVGRDGRTADKSLLKPPSGSGNVIDGPVLEWLNRQPAPRVWVCDGVVTGVGDQTCKSLTRDALRLMGRGNVARVHSVADLVSALA